MLVGGLVPGVLALALAGCSVEIVDDEARTPDPTAGAAREAVPRDAEPQDPAPDQVRSPSASSGTAGAASSPGGAEPVPGDLAGAGGTGAPAVPRLPTRDDLRPLTTGQTACEGADLTRERAGDAVEVTDGCGTLTVAGADSLVVAGDVEHLVVAGAGARVAVRSVTTVTIAAAAVTVTWEDGSPTVTDSGPGSRYGSVGAG